MTQTVLVGADFSSVESIGVSWFAGEAWKLATYQQFFETGDPALEPYCVTASKILGRPVTPEDKAGRQLGKQSDLSCGFGGGSGAWRRFAPDDTRGDEDIAQLISAWRREHRAIVRYWKRLERAAHHCLRTRQPTRAGRVAFRMAGDTLQMVLPSGRAIAYPEARLVPGKFDTAQIAFKDNARGGWSEQRAWHGTLIENATQGLCRDLLASSMLRLERAGYELIMHTHDELVAMAAGHGNVAEFVQIMTEVPAWAEGFPLHAKGWQRQCYAEPAQPPSAPLSAPPVPAVPAETIPPAPAAPVPVITTPSELVTTAPTISTRIPLRDLIEGINAEGKILCPFHADSRPSLHIFSDHCHCFACGAHLEAVDYLMMVGGGMNREQALDVLEGRAGAHLLHRPALPPPDPDRSLRAALAIWEAAKPLGDLARLYFTEVRGIDAEAIPIDDAALRFHPQCPFDHGTTPCIVALLRDALTDELAGIHRIALTLDVFTGAKVQRRMLGRWPRPRAIKLWPANGQLYLAEGIETALAAAMLGKRPAWAAATTSNIQDFPVLPGLELTLLVDHDDAGIAAADACRARWKMAGREVERLLPQQLGQDFNDIVLAQRKQRAAVCA